MSVRALVATVVTVVLVAAICLAVVYVRRESAEAKANGNGSHIAGRTGEDRPMVEVEEFALEHHEQGRPAWKVQLSSLAVETGGTALTARGLREGLIYGQDGKPAVRITASEVDYNTVSYDFDMTGSVRVVSPRGAVITTNTVHWDNESRVLTTPGRIVLRTKDGMTVSTAGMRFDTGTQTVFGPNQVKLDTGRSACVGKNLKYPLETGRWTLESVQMVVDVKEAEERTGRG